MSIETQNAAVELRYADQAGQLVVGGKDIAGRVVNVTISGEARGCRLSLDVLARDGRSTIQVDVDAIELVATVPLSDSSVRVLEAIASPPRSDADA